MDKTNWTGKKKDSSSSQQRRRGGGMVSPSPSSLHTPWLTDNSARDLQSEDFNFNSNSKHD
jgi:kinesin family protein 11